MGQLPGVSGQLVILLVGVAYAAVFALMFVLRREGFSSQFILESLVLTLLIAAGGTLTGSQANPIFFLAFLYIMTMRCRLLVDAANLLSARGRQRDAISTLQVALKLLPDKATRLIVLVNMGIIQLRRENPQSAQKLLEIVLEEAKTGGLGTRYEAACQYHLGLAFQRQEKERQAAEHFDAAVEAFPGSPYGRLAEKALQERRQRITRKKDSANAAGKVDLS